MRYVNLGNTGPRVSRVCLGMMSFGRHKTRQWALDEAAAEPIVRRAVDGGVSFFDTADVYNGGQSEIVTGRLLGKLFGSREEYVVATKVHGRTMPGENGRGLSRKHILASIDTSLGRLGLDYVDLYQIHRWDSLTPIEETMDVLHDVVKAGKARYLGASGAGDDPPVPRPGGWHRALEPAGARAAGGHRHPQRRAANHAGPHRSLPPLALPARPRPSGD